MRRLDAAEREARTADSGTLDRLSFLEREAEALRADNERLLHESTTAQVAAASSKAVAQADHRVLRAQIERDETDNACMEAVNMLRESHRALMHNDTALRSELKDLHQRYRADAHHWKKNFRDLQQYYQGLASAPPPDTANVTMWPPTPVRHDDDDAEDEAMLRHRAMAAAWGPRVTRDAEEAMARVGVGSSSSSSSRSSRGSTAAAPRGGFVSGRASQRGFGRGSGASSERVPLPEGSAAAAGAASALFRDRGVAEVGEFDLMVSALDGRHTSSSHRDGPRGAATETVGSLSPRAGTAAAAGAEAEPNTTHNTSSSRRRRAAEFAEEEIREKLQWTQAMSSAKTTIESSKG
jgi:hypothetical protein